MKEFRAYRCSTCQGLSLAYRGKPPPFCAWCALESKARPPMTSDESYIVFKLTMKDFPEKPTTDGQRALDGRRPPRRSEARRIPRAKTA